MEWGWTRSTVLSNGDIVIYGRETESTPPALYIYTAGGQYRRTLPLVCKHEGQKNLIALTTYGRANHAVSCIACHVIYLINLATDGTNIAFKDAQLNLGVMTTDDRGTLYVEHETRSVLILELDCSRLPFTHTSFKPPLRRQKLTV